MPWSWVRVPTGTSPALSDCVAPKGATRQAYAECIGEIITGLRGTVGPDDVKFEANGKWAHVHFWWARHEDKLKIMFALDASDGIDLLTAAEVDALESEPDSAS